MVNCIRPNYLNQLKISQIVDWMIATISSGQLSDRESLFACHLRLICSKLFSFCTGQTVGTQIVAA